MALTKGTATDYLDLLAELDAFIVADWVTAAVVNAAGTGYSVDDILTIAGGTVTHHAAQVIVTSVGGSGEVTGVRVYDSGGYSADPTLTANAVTGGGGSSCTLDLTMTSDPWVIELSSTIETTEEARVYHGPGASGVFVGLRTYQEDTGARQARNWALFGCTSYNGGLPWYQQPDICPDAGFSTTDGTMATDGNGAIAVFKDNDGTPMDYWIHVTARRIIVIAKLYDGVTTTPRYSSLYMGLLNPFGTSDEYPYPLYVSGSTSFTKCAWDDLVPAFHFNGITVCHGETNEPGPGLYYGVDGLWKIVQNARLTFGASTMTEQNTHVLYPCGNNNLLARPSGDDIAVDSSSTLQWENMINVTGSYSTAPGFELWPTPDSGGEKRLLVPAVLTLTNSSIPADYQMVGELDGVKWVSASGTTQATAEDELDDADNGEFHRIYPNGTLNGILWGYMCIRED